MITLFFLLLLLLAMAALCGRRKRHGLALVSIITATVTLLGVGCGPATAALLAFVQQRAPERPTTVEWASRSAIIVLGVGVQRSSPTLISPIPASYGRLVQAQHAYSLCAGSGATCTIYVSGGDPEGLGRSEAKTYADVLVSMGVPRERLVVEEESRNTWENARNTTAMLDANNEVTRVLITSRVHLYRSLRYFRHFGAEPIGWWSDDLVANETLVPSALNIAMADIVANELIGLARYAIYTRLGLND